MLPTPSDVVARLREHPARHALTARVSQVVLSAAEHRQPTWLSSPQVAELDSRALVELDRNAAETPFGNALEILDRGASSPAEWMFLAACVAFHLGGSGGTGAGSEIAGVSSGGVRDETRSEESSPAARWYQLDAPSTMGALLWLSSATPCNVWLFADPLLEHVGSFWDEAKDALMTGASSAVLPAAGGLMNASCDGALRLKTALASSSGDPTVRYLLAACGLHESLSGELHRAPPPPWSLVLQTLTGWLALVGIARLIGRHGLGLRRSGELRVRGGSIELLSRRHLLGRRLSEKQEWISLGDVRLLTRQTRFEGLGLYAGLIALSLGTFVGVGLISDALRVSGGSTSLLGFGAAFVLLGVVLDLVFSSLGRFRSGKTRVVLRTKRGTGVALGVADAGRADRWLSQLAAASSAAP